MLAGRELITRLTGGQFERDRKAIGIDQCMNLAGHHLVTCPWTVFCSERCKQRAGEAKTCRSSARQVTALNTIVSRSALPRQPAFGERLSTMAGRGQPTKWDA
jgi:hypothetical protein